MLIEATGMIDTNVCDTLNGGNVVVFFCVLAGVTTCHEVDVTSPKRYGDFFVSRAKTPHQSQWHDPRARANPVLYPTELRENKLPDNLEGHMCLLKSIHKHSVVTLCKSNTLGKNTFLYHRF